MASTPKNPANTKAWGAVKSPLARGLPRVRAMAASVLRSAKWLNAAADMAAKPMPVVANINAHYGIIDGGDVKNILIMVVNIIKVIILSLYKVK